MSELIGKVLANIVIWLIDGVIIFWLLNLVLSHLWTNVPYFSYLDSLALIIVCDTLFNRKKGGCKK